MDMKKILGIGLFIFVSLCLFPLISSSYCTELNNITEKPIVPGADSYRVVISLVELTPNSNVQIRIYEKDGSSSNSIRNISATTDSKGNANILWIPTQADLDKTPHDYDNFYFIAGTYTSGYLKLIDLTEVYWKDDDDNFIGQWTERPNVTVSTVKETQIMLVWNHPGLDEDAGVVFEIKQDKPWPLSDKDITTLQTIVTSEGAKAVWNVDTAELDKIVNDDYEGFYFTAISGTAIGNKESGRLELVKYTPSIDMCEELTTCEHYDNQVDCVQNPCNLEPLIEGIICEEQGEHFSYGSEWTDCYYYTNCKCKWDSEDGCTPGYSKEINDPCTNIPIYPVSMGYCSVTQIGESECTDGFLAYSWNGTWDWKDNRYLNQSSAPLPSVADGGEWHYGTLYDKSKCTAGGTGIYPCPTSIALSFFGGFELVIAVIVIVLIYYFIFLFRKKIRKKSDKKPQKRKKVRKK